MAVATGKLPFAESTGFIHLQDLVVNRPIPNLAEAHRQEIGEGEGRGGGESKRTQHQQEANPGNPDADHGDNASSKKSTGDASSCPSSSSSASHPMTDTTGVKRRTWSNEVVQFVASMLNKDPGQRPSAQGLLEHAFMQGHDNDAFAEKPEGKHHKLWQQQVGTSAIDGAELLPEIRRVVKAYVEKSGHSLCKKIFAHHNVEKVAAGQRWKKLKNT
mmetsp:Transcript_11931/g.19125  ORF Transcript_11931/g.19125 Transcript_11931/m.19125 type:complete len:216 (+) Transcript_11931:122-769(+)|eukprot:jgi/Bigna1/134497/aug1.25_g9205